MFTIRYSLIVYTSIIPDVYCGIIILVNSDCYLTLETNLINHIMRTILYLKLKENIQLIFYLTIIYDKRVTESYTGIV